MNLFKREKQDRKRFIWYRNLSLLIVIVLLVGILPFIGTANNKGKVITSFEMPVTEVTVPAGTRQRDLPLPEILEATLAGGASAEVSVVWEDSGLYDKNIAGVYLFTAHFSGYIYAQPHPVAVVTVDSSDELSFAATPSVASCSNAIRGKVWLDEIGDGVMSEMQNGIGNYPISLYDADNRAEAIAMTQTKGDGSYYFKNMKPGNYVVGITPETIGETVYLLPQSGTSEDNKFVADEQAVIAYSEMIEIPANEDAEVEDVDAGVLLGLGLRAGNTWYPTNFIQLKAYVAQASSDDVIVITNDIIFPEPITVTKSLTFRSNSGRRSFLYNGYDERHIIIQPTTMANRITVTFENIIFDGYNRGGGILVQSNKDLILNLPGSEIKNCFAQYGGAIQFERTSAPSIINGGVIAANTAGAGGGISVGSGAPVTINGMQIVGNVTDGSGGGLSVSGSELIINDSEISRNEAIGGHGGGLSIGLSTVTITSSKLTNNIGRNTEEDFGVGGGFHGFESTITVEDCEFSGNEATSGGGVILYGGMVTIANTTFTNNLGRLDGGAIAIHSISTKNTTLFLTGGEISNNRTNGVGGGISEQSLYSLKSDITVTGTSITNNQAVRSGGGIYSSGGTVTMNNSNIVSNTSPSGGGVSLSGTNFTLQGSEISGNRALVSQGVVESGRGGGIYEKGSSVVTVKGGSKIKENSVVSTVDNTGKGGGVYLAGSQFIMQNGEITGNTTNQAGGGIYSEGNGVVRVDAGKISDNVAVNGGGIYMETLANLTVTSTAVVFRDNVAAEANDINAADMNLHAQKIQTTHFTVPFNFAYSNFDVGYKNTAVGAFYKVAFDTQGGNVIASKLAAAGSTITAPSPDPVRDGYTFSGWYKEPEFQTLWDFAADTVTSDVTLYAKWIQGVNITISKTVEGSYASKTKDFPFSIRFVDEDGNKFASGTEISYLGGMIPDLGAAAPADGMMTLDSNGEAVFTLKHGQKITISGLAAGTKVQIIETDTTGYVPTFMDGTDWQNGADTGEYELGNEARTFAFKNTKVAVIPTGVVAGGMQGLIILTCSTLLLGVVLYAGQIYRRNKRG